MKDKICPMLAIGIFASGVTKNYDNISKYLPKCLKEDCRLWVEEYMLKPGYCGMRNKKD